MNEYSSYLLLAVLFLITAATGCSTSKSFYLAPDYQENPVESDVLIMAVERSQFENFYDHTFGSLSGTEREAFRTQLEPLFRQYSGSSAQLNEEEELSLDEFEVQTLELGSRSIDVMIPREGTDLTLNETETDARFLLLLDQFVFRQASELVGGSVYAGHEGDEKEFLHFETKYIYWDTDTKKPVGWGIARGKTEVGMVASGEDYSEVLSQAMEDIAKNGPVQVAPQ